MIRSFFSTPKRLNPVLCSKDGIIYWTFRMDGKRLEIVVVSQKRTHGILSVFVRGKERPKWGQREGKERVRIGSSLFTLSLPSLYPHLNISLQWINCVEIQNKLQCNKLQKIKQNKEWFGFRYLIGFNGTPVPPADGDWCKVQNRLTICLKIDIIYFRLLKWLNSNWFFHYLLQCQNMWIM